ncbi:amidohydrolase family protein [Streptomyces sp. NPDC048297]|uniref:amidohydrolase family protein n=1 Tax=Streptomyces sp. NPDC048297 TaxID=3365531 RepID=UPI00372140E7
MCLNHPAPPPPTSLARRGVLGAAMALVGASAITGATGGIAAAAERTTHGSRDSRDSGAPRGTLVIEGGTLLDPLTGEVTEDSVVVIEDGVVTAAGSRNATRAARAALPSTVHVVAAHGKWVLPGLVDAHIHLNSLAEARAALHQGATSVRSGSTNFYQDIALRELARWAPEQVPGMRAAGVFVTPDLGDTILADPDLAPLARLKGGVTSTEALRRVVQVNLERGVDVVKTRSNPRAGLAEQDPLQQVYTREQLATVVAAARKGGKGVLCHSYSETGCRDAVFAGVRSMEHGVFVTEDTLHEMSRRGTFFTPTIGAIAGMIGDADPILDERGRTYVPILQRAVRAAHDMGVPVAAGTDSAGGVVDPIGGEVVRMREAGLSVLDAIRTATTSAAELLGQSRSIGRLAKGFHGDAVLFDRSPLEDLTVLKTPSAVIHTGIAVTV